MAGDFLMGTSIGKGIKIWNSCEWVGYPAEVLRLGSGQHMETNKTNVQNMLTLLLAHLCLPFSPARLLPFHGVFEQHCNFSVYRMMGHSVHIREQWSLGFEYFQISGCILPLFILISTEYWADRMEQGWGDAEGKCSHPVVTQCSATQRVLHGAGRISWDFP